MGGVLDKFLAFKIGNVIFPTGLIPTFILLASIVWVFSKSKKGTAMIVAGSSEAFAASNGVNVDKQKNYRYSFIYSPCRKLVL